VNPTIWPKTGSVNADDALVAKAHVEIDPVNATTRVTANRIRICKDLSLLTSDRNLETPPRQ